MRPRPKLSRRILRRAFDCALRDGLPVYHVSARIRLHVLPGSIAAADRAPHPSHPVHGRDASERGYRFATGLVASLATIFLAQSGAR